MSETTENKQNVKAVLLKLQEFQRRWNAAAASTTTDQKNFQTAAARKRKKGKEPEEETEEEETEEEEEESRSKHIKKGIENEAEDYINQLPIELQTQIVEILIERGESSAVFTFAESSREMREVVEAPFISDILIKRVLEAREKLEATDVGKIILSRADNLFLQQRSRQQKFLMKKEIRPVQGITDLKALLYAKKIIEASMTLRSSHIVIATAYPPGLSSGETTAHLFHGIRALEEPEIFDYYQEMYEAREPPFGGSEFEIVMREVFLVLNMKLIEDTALEERRNNARTMSIIPRIPLKRKIAYAKEVLRDDWRENFMKNWIEDLFVTLRITNSVGVEISEDFKEFKTLYGDELDPAFIVDAIVMNQLLGGAVENETVGNRWIKIANILDYRPVFEYSLAMLLRLDEYAYLTDPVHWEKNTSSQQSHIASYLFWKFGLRPLREYRENNPVALSYIAEAMRWLQKSQKKDLIAFSERTGFDVVSPSDKPLFL